MLPAIRTRFEKLEQQKRTMLLDAAKLTSVRQHYRPTANAWSTLDVLDHLMKVEAGFLHAVREHLCEAVRVRFSDRIGGLLVNAVMLSPLRVKVPAKAAIVLPEASPDLPRINAGWACAREEMAGLLASLEPDQLTIGLFQHPVAGWMTIQTGLVFLSAHLRHHRYQLRRLRSASLRP